MPWRPQSSLWMGSHRPEHHFTDIDGRLPLRITKMLDTMEADLPKAESVQKAKQAETCHIRVDGYQSMTRLLLSRR